MSQSLSSQKLQHSRSEALYEEGKRLVPGGVLGIRRPYNFVPGEYPIFIESGQGGRVTDPDGNVIEISHNQGVYDKVRELWGRSSA